MAKGRQAADLSPPRDCMVGHECSFNNVAQTTDEPWLIGHAVSNSCVRMTNANIVDLYRRAHVGTRVLVI